MLYKEHSTVKSFICASLHKTHAEVCPFAFTENPRGSTVRIHQNEEAVHHLRELHLPGSIMPFITKASCCSNDILV